MKAKLEFYQLTAIGDKDINQDCMANKVGDDYAIFIVADGLGGHLGGEKASKYFCRGLLNCVDAYRGLIKTRGGPAIKDWIDAGIKNMWEYFAGDPEMLDARTTCAILYLDQSQVITAHCGDSRVYRLNPQGILWRTRDHSQTQKLVDEGVISEREMGLHPEQNQLTRSINALTEPWIEIQGYPPMALGETFILCSDGFWERIKEQELLQLSQPETGKAELKKMAQLTVLRAQGNSDNVTVQWVRKVS